MSDPQQKLRGEGRTLPMRRREEGLHVTVRDAPAVALLRLDRLTATEIEGLAFGLATRGDVQEIVENSLPNLVDAITSLDGITERDKENILGRSMLTAMKRV